MDRERSRWLLLGLCAGYFLVLLDVTVVNVALPSIGVGLHASASALAWVVDAYTVPLAALLLASGAIGDQVGHRRVVLLGFVGFGAASVLCALAPGTAVLVGGRALQGMCAALMLPGTLALLTESAPDDRARTRMVALWAAVGGAALPAGPLVGGLLVDIAGWRAVFWLSVPVIIAALVPVARSATVAGPTTAAGPTATAHSATSSRSATTVGPTANTSTASTALLAGERGGPRRGVDPLGGVDWTGAGALVLVLGAAVTAVIEARSFPRLSLGMIVLVGLGAFVLWRAERTATRPLLVVPKRARGRLAAACAVAGLMNLCVLGSLFLLTQVFQDAHRLRPLTAGLLLLPGMLPLPLLGSRAGRLTSRFGPWRISALGLALAAAGFLGIAASIGGPTYPALLVSLAVWGSGIGVLTPAIVTAAMQSIPERPGTASGAGNTARQTGGALGVAVFSAFAGSAAGSTVGSAGGGAADGAFVRHTSLLLVCAAAAFAFAAVFCVGRGVRFTIDSGIDGLRVLRDDAAGPPRAAPHSRPDR